MGEGNLLAHQLKDKQGTNRSLSETQVAQEGTIFTDVPEFKTEREGDTLTVEDDGDPRRPGENETDTCDAGNRNTQIMEINMCSP